MKKILFILLFAPLFAFGQWSFLIPADTSTTPGIATKYDLTTVGGGGGWTVSNDTVYQHDYNVWLDSSLNMVYISPLSSYYLGVGDSILGSGSPNPKIYLGINHPDADSNTYLKLEGGNSGYNMGFELRADNGQIEAKIAATTKITNPSMYIGLRKDFDGYIEINNQSFAIRSSGIPITIESDTAITLDSPDGIYIIPFSAAPANPAEGTLYYDPEDNMMYFWDGTAWRPMYYAEP
jgi:hypothetical protein